MQLIAAFPMLAVYAYHAYCHYEKNESMYIHRPEKDLSIAENFLRLLRPDTKFTELEARVLDIALLLHMEHGGGNNSTFYTYKVFCMQLYMFLNFMLTYVRYKISFILLHI